MVESSKTLGEMYVTVESVKEVDWTSIRTYVEEVSGLTTAYSPMQLVRNLFWQFPYLTKVRGSSWRTGEVHIEERRSC